MSCFYCTVQFHCEQCRINWYLNTIYRFKISFAETNVVITVLECIPLYHQSGIFIELRKMK